MLEPWFAPGTLEARRVSVQTAQSADVRVCRMSHTEVDGRMSLLRFKYLIGRPTGIERATEIHELGLFTRDEMQESFRRAELRATFDPEGLDGRGLYIARAA